MQCYWDIGPPCTVAGQLRPAAIASPRAVVPYVDFDKGWSSENQLNPLGNGQRETGSIESSLLVSRNAIFGLAMFGRVWLIYRFWDSYGFLKLLSLANQQSARFLRCMVPSWCHGVLGASATA